MHAPTQLLLCASLSLLAPVASANRIDTVDDSALVEQLLAARPGEPVDLSIGGERRLSVSWEGPLVRQHRFASGPLVFEPLNAVPAQDMAIPADIPAQGVAEPAALMLILAALGALAFSYRPRAGGRA